MPSLMRNWDLHGRRLLRFVLASRSPNGIYPVSGAGACDRPWPAEQFNSTQNPVDEPRGHNSGWRTQHGVVISELPTWSGTGNVILKRP